MARGSFAWRRLTEYFDEARDAFNVPVTRNTANSVDIPSYHPFSEERLRLRLNGTATNHSDLPNQFIDEESDYLLAPDAGNRLRIHSAERPRYIVGFEAQGSMAAKMNTPLETGDTMRVGLTDNRSPETGAKFEINADGPNRAVLKDAGTEVASSEWEWPSDPQLSEETPIRYEIQFNWYNVGRYLFSIAYTDGSEDMGDRQRKDVVAELTVDDDFATSVGAYHIFSELDATNAGKELIAGSMAFVVLGDVNETSRVKADRQVLNGAYGGSGEYEAVYAMRLDQSRRDTYVQLDKVSVFPTSTSGELNVIAVQADQTDATGFATPVAQSDHNTAIEVTDNVSTFPNEAGDLVTTATNPNGYQLQFASYEATGQGTNARASEQSGAITKRPLYDNDVAIFLYKADDTTADDLVISHITEQNF